MNRLAKTFLQMLIVVALITIFTQVLPIAAAKQLVPLTQQSVDQYKSGLIPGPYGTEVNSIELAKELIFTNLLGYAKAIIAIIAILYITIIAYRLLVQGGDEEKVKKAKDSLVYIIIALVLVSMSQDIAKIFDMEDHTILENPDEILKRVHLFDTQVEMIVTFIKYIIATFATLMLIRSALKMITAGGNEEETGKHKKSILFSIGGLLLIYVGDIFINRVFYKIDKTTYNAQQGMDLTVDTAQGVKEIVSITNAVVSFVGPVAILMLIVGAIMYVTAGGEEERMNKAKRLLTATVIGIIMIFGAFALVSTILSGSLPIEQA